MHPAFDEYRYESRKSESDLFSGFAALRKRKRVTVAQGAAEALYINQPGGFVGPWSPSEAPYMVQPMNEATNPAREALVFVGPARTGKTLGLLDGFVAYTISCDPGDTLIVQMTQDKAREFSRVRIGRELREGPILPAYVSKHMHDNNIFDRTFKHGMYMKIGWPVASQLSGSDYRFVIFTDYDRQPDDIDGEGSGFMMGLKRTQTFGTRGMCVVESSPGRDYEDPGWTPASAHEAPPCTGSLGIYNRSSRARWYWPCPHCAEFFQAAPGLGLFCLPDEIELLEVVRESNLEQLAEQYNRIVCPHCGAVITPEHKAQMNARGLWLDEGQTVSPDGQIVGERHRSSIGGYWLGGVAAAYQSWYSMLLRYLQGLREYVLTANELSLKTTVNTDQGMPYMPRLIAYAKNKADGPHSRAEKHLQRFIVPYDTRFLVAAVDVQGGATSRFVVQVHAVSADLRKTCIDRYAITESQRTGVDGGKAPIDPAAYGEDWQQITDLVVKATYRLEDGREMRVRLVVVDTGGEDGVTAKAYDWYRGIRADGENLSRVMLIKGASTKTAPLIKESWVGNKRAAEKGDVPLYMLNPNLFKDIVANGLKRESVGPGYYHFGAWLPKSFFDELQAEVRNANGVWVKLRRRNEAFDLSAYIEAGIVRLGADRVDSFDWDNPPPWAAPLDLNIDVITTDQRRNMQGAAAPTVAVRRQATRSSYVSGR